MKIPKIVTSVHVVLLTLFLTTSAFSRHSNAIRLSADEVRVVSGFTKVAISGAFKVILIQGASEGISVKANPKVMKNIITKVEGSTLKINSEGMYYNDEEIELTINFISLVAMDCSGSTQLSGEGQLKFDNFEFSASGSAKAELNFLAKKLDIDMSGAGHLNFQGAVNEVELDISGSGKFMAASLTSDKYEINISGSGNAEIAVASILEVDISGSGVVKYKGEPTISRDISGSAKIIKL
ncbi:MAG: DUF2807 domain-containing protein [Bacteroidetes bacterium]|nr:DUF2807 domain-containing protein [Bacteroidota bacterium]